MDFGVNTASYSAANYFIEGLNEIGIEYLFSNMGTDHAPDHRGARRPQRGAASRSRRSSVARMRTRRRTWPAAMRWRPAAARACWCMSTSAPPIPSNAMHNLYRSRMPVLLMAGKAPFTAHGELIGTRDNYVHFVQEPFDQGEPGAALHEMGMDAAFRRRRQGSAAARPHRSCRASRRARSI